MAKKTISKSVNDVLIKVVNDVLIPNNSFSALRFKQETLIRYLAIKILCLVVSAVKKIVKETK